jgi:polysaccharide deacetylase 2 family uncharacterized protein YibQ
LNRPLGLEPAPARRPSLAALLATGAVLAAAAGIAIIARSDDRLGGEPYAVATIDEKPAAAPPAPRPSAAPATTGQPEQLSASQIEAQSGVKIVRNGGAAPPGSLIIEVPQALGLHLNPAPDERLVERSRYGLLPRIGADGAQPAEVYARPPLIPANLKGAPRIALLVGGLGLSEEGTAQAIRQLPGAVSLGFAPYGGGVERLVADAREAGHEAILQIPMESFDASSPGPHTLKTSAGESQILDDLRWLMGRFPGYVGVANYLGAKFTADETALSPVLRDIAGRGLIYVDDGSSPRSLARALAGQLNLPAASADVVIDATPTPQAIDEALTRLEGLARANGSAIGVASALPISVDHIAHWARSLEGRGLALTPISAIVTRGPGKAAAIAAPAASR